MNKAHQSSIILMNESNSAEIGRRKVVANSEVWGEKQRFSFTGWQLVDRMLIYLLQSEVWKVAIAIAKKPRDALQNVSSSSSLFV